MPKTYTLSPDKLAASLRKTRLLFGGMLLTVLLLYVLIQGSATRDWTSILLTVAVSLLLLAFAWRNVVRQQTALWESVRIELGEDYVARQQLRVAQLRIARSEVHAIEETGDGLRLRGADKRPLLAIPTALADADYQEIRAALSTWAPIESKSSQARTQSRLLNALSVVSILVLFFSPGSGPRWSRASSRSASSAMAGGSSARGAVSTRNTAAAYAPCWASCSLSWPPSSAFWAACSRRCSMHSGALAGSKRMMLARQPRRCISPGAYRFRSPEEIVVLLSQQRR